MTSDRAPDETDPADSAAAGRSGRPGRTSRPPRYRPKGRAWGAIVAVGVLWLFSAVLPILGYVDAATVPSGTTTSQATVTGYYSSGRPNRRSSNGVGGRFAYVEVAGEKPVEGEEQSVRLDARFDYPDEGDILTVYREDGELRSTEEGSWAGLVVAGVLLVFWPTALLGYLRARRRGETT